MEPEIRGSVEQYIDFALSDAQMAGYQQYIKNLKPYVKSTEDAVLGLVIGMIVASCLDRITLFGRRAPTQSDINELRRIVKDRLPRIRSRVLETLV